LITTDVIFTKYEQSASTSQEIKDKLISTMEKGDFTVTHAHDFLEFMLKDVEKRQELTRLLRESKTLSSNFRIIGRMIGEANVEKDGFIFHLKCFKNSSPEPVHYMVIYVHGEMHGCSTISILKKQLLPYLQNYKK